jgi:predicted aconitase
MVGHFPRAGEHVAWSESSAVAFANAVLGARTNREGGFSSMASALTGRTPEYGFHLAQNRYGDLEISVTTELQDIHDYGTLGYFAGKLAGDRIPVFTGIPPSVSIDALKMLGAGASASGSVAHYHIVGVTAEAPTKDAAFGPKGEKNREIFPFGEKELREAEESISRTNDREIDFIVFGCPHASITEMAEIARLLSGKRIHPGVELWVLTSRIVRSYAERMGYVNTIEATGAKVLSDTCTNSMPRGFLKGQGHRIGASSSAKIIYGIAGQQSMLLHYGSTTRCIQAAVRGKWE